MTRPAAGKAAAGTGRAAGTGGASGRAALVSTRAELDAALDRLGPITLVPTMGALHSGHRALIRRARRVGGPVVVSVFVNPLQFGPGEDLDRYPRTLAADLEMCRAEGVELVYAPDRAEVYRGEQMVRVDPGPMGRVLEGASRPGFFDGVLTVVLKLLHQTRARAAVFGRKDAQQLALVRRMVADLDLAVRIIAVPTVRDPDGLAVSSRNAYLDRSERESALVLSRALFAGRDALAGGPAAVLGAAGAVLAGAARATPPVALDYLALVDPRDFTEVPSGGTVPAGALLVVAARVGSTRLIDNVVLTPAPDGEE